MIELGTKYPCTTQGHEVDIETDTIEAGDILECYFQSDYTISSEDAYNAAKAIIQIKEHYPDLVIHYFKSSGNLITIQYSIAPSSGISRRIAFAQIVAIIIVLLLILGIIITFYALQRGYVLPVKKPMGDAVILAKDYSTQLAISGAEIFVDGVKRGVTGASGSVLVKNLLAGEHNFEGGGVDGYQPPAVVKATVVANQQLNVNIVYYPEGMTPPTTGWLIIYTNINAGQISIDGAPYVDAPVVIIDQPVGQYTIAFSSVDGYVTPPVQTATVQGGEKTPIEGVYEPWQNKEEWWQTIVKYALIGGGVIVGLAVLVPNLVSSLQRKRLEGEK
jgi:hypothetical protein